ncbi:hypothetical protein KJ068_13555 [bacterium]|nr:hypothetical protein [bacterium]
MQTDLKLIAALLEKFENKYYGKYRGVVTDNQDPKKLGRIRVNVPGLLGPQVQTGWAMPCLPYGGAFDLGFFFLPEIGSGVWVEFEGGDLEFPIWVGTYWAIRDGNSELPQVAQSERTLTIKDPSGSMIQMSPGKLIIDGGENAVVIKGKMIDLNPP